MTPPAKNFWMKPWAHVMGRLCNYGDHLVMKLTSLWIALYAFMLLLFGRALSWQVHFNFSVLSSQGNIILLQWVVYTWLWVNWNTSTGENKWESVTCKTLKQHLLQKLCTGFLYNSPSLSPSIYIHIYIYNNVQFSVITNILFIRKPIFPLSIHYQNNILILDIMHSLRL